MTDDFRHLRLDRNGRGVATVALDVQGVPVNVFDEEVVRELVSVVSRLEADPPRLVVFRSAKPSGFLAGADVKRIRRIETEVEARAVLAAGQELFDRIERLPCPTIAVIHGPCLGGGLELALACRHRVARDDAATRIGLPEVQLGLIPGWGGTQRLPRLVGLRQALRMILEGATLPAARASKVGLVDLAAPADSFDAAVNRFIDDRLAGRPVRRPGRGLLGAALDGTRPGRLLVLAAARRRLGVKAGQYPALPAALRAVEAGLRGGHAAGLAAERDEFANVLFGPVARNLLELFLQRERARKLSTWVAGGTPRPVRKVAVVGAGTMGAGIAQLVALSGTPVALKDIDAATAVGGMERVKALTDEAAGKGVMSRGEAEAVVRNVTPTATWEPLADADLAVEAVLEREDVKRDVFRQLAEKLPAGAVLASNTSALSISRLAEAVPNPERVAGLHFFNPVHRMPLVEVVRGRATDDETVATLVELVRKLGKVPVVVADSPGFLVNRLLFPYLDEAVRLTIECGRGQSVDAEAESFGMPMGPLALLDQIGVDIAADVAGTFAHLRSDPGPTPERFAAMVREGYLGKKSGRGFYKYENGERGVPTHWAWDGKSSSPGGEAVAPGELTPVQRRLIYPIINEAAKCLESGVVSEGWMIDLAMVLGTGFAPFRGGPLRTADALGIGRVVRELDDLARTTGTRFEPCPLLRTMAADGRGFYEAGIERSAPSVAAVEEVHR